MKKMLYLIIVLSMLNNVFAASEAVNTSVSELKNLTRADNVLDYHQEINTLTDGMLGILIAVIIFIVILGIGILNGKTIEAAAVGFFVDGIIVIMLRISGLVTDQVVGVCILGLLACIGVIIASK